MDTPISEDGRARQWLLCTALLALVWLPRTALVAGWILVCLYWDQGWIVAMIAPALLWQVLPALDRHGRLPGRALRPDDEPELAALIRDVAERLGFDKPLLVRVVPDVDASLGRVRVEGTDTCVLLLGLPLLRALTAARLASVVAHELAHERHVSDRRLSLLGFARARAEDRLEGRFRPTAPLLRPLLRASQPLTWRTETAADAEAARLAGTRATAEALRLTTLLDTVWTSLGEPWVDGLAEDDAYPEDFYDALDAALADPQVARRALRAGADEDTLDPYATAQHPPLEQRLAALPHHTGTPYPAEPVPLRTAAAVETWCLRALVHGEQGPDPEGSGEEPLRPVRLLELPDGELRELGESGVSAQLCRATGRATPAEAVSAALDAIAAGTWAALARRLVPSLRHAPAAERTVAGRAVVATAVGDTLAELLLADGRPPGGRWIRTVLLTPDRPVDLREEVAAAVDSGDPGPLRALLTSTGPKETVV
ncbi:M48 family metalloprotease [Streptomyces sp. Amel2xC10]|uniref:M48 family metalloprotease n=1 Tax=Streptomyces sp. Amel2xC10 TaxID=1305826 RepID=UPI000A08C203|nr:M48 family metalloprotease [Streptomyces sp. Amel2xC10]SMF15507.1 Zn-dependent protease with chaperone function [Streptomyces sp. Amel2xC10]